MAGLGMSFSLEHLSSGSCELLASPALLEPCELPDDPRNFSAPNTTQFPTRLSMCSRSYSTINELRPRECSTMSFVRAESGSMAEVAEQHSMQRSLRKSNRDEDFGLGRRDADYRNFDGLASKNSSASTVRRAYQQRFASAPDKSGSEGSLDQQDPANLRFDESHDYKLSKSIRVAHKMAIVKDSARLRWHRLRYKLG